MSDEISGNAQVKVFFKWKLSWIIGKYSCTNFKPTEMGICRLHIIVKFYEFSCMSDTYAEDMFMGANTRKLIAYD